MLAGDSAGGYLALALAQRLQAEGEEPAALVAISPLLQLDQGAASRPTRTSTPMRCSRPRLLTRWSHWSHGRRPSTSSTASPKSVYEPLDHIEPGLPRTLIHVRVRRCCCTTPGWRRAGWPPRACRPRCGCGRARSTTSSSAHRLVPEAKRSLRQIGEYIREATG